MHGKKLINNSVISIAYRVTLLLLGFVTRKIFIIFLGEELLGLNSLYANLLDLLNLADLGIGVAVQYQLYQPLVQKDYDKLSRIITAAKRIYNTIGCFILAAGIVLSFFIQNLIKSTTYPIWYVREAFLISVTGIACGYFLVHERLFLQANEDIGLVNIIDLIAKLGTVILSLVTTILFGNYFVYLIINALYGISGNLLIHFLFKRKYAQIDTRVRDIQPEVRALTSNLQNVVPMKLSNYVYNSTDNVIISKVLGLSVVAIYSNYMTIINGIMGIEYLLGNAVLPTLGKIINEEKDQSKVRDYFLMFQYVQFAFTAFCTVSLAMLCKPFITLWIGEHFLAENLVFILLIVDFYIHSMYQPAYVMYGAAGKFKEDKLVTLASAVMNIVISIVLVQYIGLPGVIVGTLITDIYIWVVRTYQIIKGYFHQNLMRYTIKMVSYTLATIVGLILSLWLSRFIRTDILLLELLFKAAICVIVPNVISVAFTFSSAEFKHTLAFLKNTLRKGGR